MEFSYRKAEALWSALHDKRGTAETLLLLGSAISDLNDLDSASACLRKALSLLIDLGDERGHTLTRLALARLLYINREYQEALNGLTELRDRFAVAGDTVWEAACVSMIGHVYIRWVSHERHSNTGKGRQSCSNRQAFKWPHWKPASTSEQGISSVTPTHRLGGSRRLLSSRGLQEIDTCNRGRYDTWE